MDQDKLGFRPKRAGEVMGVGRSTVYELIKTGELETITIGRCRLVLAESIQAYIKRRRKAGVAG